MAIMDCPNCGYVMGPLDKDCPRCNAGYVPPGRAYPPAPSIVVKPLRYCPRCQQEIPPDYENCPRCADPTPFLRPAAEQQGRRWHPLDIALALAMATYVLIYILSGGFVGLLGLGILIVTVVVYGLVFVDIWQDENSFGTYAFILTWWDLFWSALFTILDPRSVYQWFLLAIQVAILAGLRNRYGQRYR